MAPLQFSGSFPVTLGRRRAAARDGNDLSNTPVWRCHLISQKCPLSHEAIRFCPSA